ncbi:MAG: helix-turn-helix domain-containing protein [Dehalococcoidales bacterium]|nr:helix-turn-helix domain-containing protein [Dehalococcoidales bacterium]
MKPIEVLVNKKTTHVVIRLVIKQEHEPKHTSNVPLSALLTIREASQMLNIHINTLRHWSDLGRIRAYRISPRGDRRFKRADIERFLTEGSLKCE